MRMCKESESAGRVLRDKPEHAVNCTEVSGAQLRASQDNAGHHTGIHSVRLCTSLPGGVTAEQAFVVPCVQQKRGVTLAEVACVASGAAALHHTFLVEPATSHSPAAEGCVVTMNR